MTLLFIRVFFLIITTIIGSLIGSFTDQALLGTGIGFGSGIALLILEVSMRQVSVRGLSSMVFGLLLGVLLAKLVADIISLVPGIGEYTLSVTRVGLTLFFSYLGAVTALRGKDEFNLIIPYVRFKRQDIKEDMVLLDTSVIIDGRVSDIYRTNFFGGRLIVPRFVLQEIQKLSDSSDDIKRQRGRRGMEILRFMQKDTTMDLHIHEDDVPEEKDVDAKLIQLAKMMDARICTNDYNLSRIASIQGVDVLNITDLVNAVKTVVFTGEELDIRLVKEGKENDQAVGYTDDGTMVVVSDARKNIGQRRSVTVTSVLQTQAGRMIFAKIKNNGK